MIGFIIAIPSLSRALQKARGRILPLGFLHVPARPQEVRHPGLPPGRRTQAVPREGRGPHHDHRRVPQRTARGVRQAESNPELETNSEDPGEWKIVATRQHKRRRIYKKTIA